MKTNFLVAFPSILAAAMAVPLPPPRGNCGLNWYSRPDRRSGDTVATRAVGSILDPIRQQIATDRSHRFEAEQIFGRRDVVIQNLSTALIDPKSGEMTVFNRPWGISEEFRQRVGCSKIANRPVDTLPSSSGTLDLSEFGFEANLMRSPEP